MESPLLLTLILMMILYNDICTSMHYQFIKVPPAHLTFMEL